MSVQFAVNIQQQLVSEECCQCGMLFAVTADFQRRCREKGDRFYCPQGHSQAYSETEVQRLKRELEAERRRLQIAKDEAASEFNLRIKEQKKRQRLEKRVNAGVCPHCKRTFRQLADHIKCKHPEVNETK